MNRIKLADNFYLDEFEDSQIAARMGFDNSVPPTLMKNCAITAWAMQKVRNALNENFGKTFITFSSGYRCLMLNRFLRSEDTSAHLKAYGVDATASGLTAKELFDFVVSRPELLELFDQVILEHNRWVHFGLAKNPRGQVLTASLNSKNKAVYKLVPTKESRNG